jgi:hypothetical protein
MFMQNMLKGPFQRQSGSCLTGRIVRANRSPVIFVSVKAPGLRRGLFLGVPSQNDSLEVEPLSSLMVAKN